MIKRPLFQPFWINKNKRHLFEKDIDDEYLINICEFVSNGFGWEEFLGYRENMDRENSPINVLFNEAYERKILRKDILFNWHIWAEFYFHYSDIVPRFKVTRDGEYKNLSDM